MAALWEQRRELTDGIIDIYQCAFEAQKDPDRRHMMLTGLLSAYSHTLSVKMLRVWKAKLEDTFPEKKEQ